MILVVILTFTDCAMKVKDAPSCPILCDPMDYHSWVSQGQNTGVGSPSLLQGIFPTQRSNPGLLHCRQILYHLSCLIINFVCSDLQFCFPLRHLLLHMHVSVFSVMSNSLRPHGLQPVKFLCPWAFSGKNTGVGGHFLIQRVFLTPGTKLASFVSPALASRFFTTELPGKPYFTWLLFSHHCPSIYFS